MVGDILDLRRGRARDEPVLRHHDEDGSARMERRRAKQAEPSVDDLRHLNHLD